MRRRVGARWLTEQLQPGDVSLLTRGAESRWRWPSTIEVVHVYLASEQLNATCRQMYEHDVSDVDLRDELKADDPAIHRTATALAAEAAQGGAGSKLLIDSLATQLCVQILRHHADVRFREPTPGGEEALSFAQERAVRGYIRDHLHESISLDDLAASVGLSRFHFARRFRRSAGTSPHAFVLSQRVELAQTMLARTDLPIADIAARCGFADQSHMNRVFQKRIRTTPGLYRASGA
jgi:AraC family transcriptional regulator